MAVEMKLGNGVLRGGVNAHGVYEFQCKIVELKKGEHNRREKDVSNN